jgi:sugar O-acyltransferase (sialic acid O-acetyltransferase NeuD family)
MISQSKNNLIIIGAGGHGRVIADAAEASECWEDIAFLDDLYPKLVISGSWPVIGKVKDALNIRGKFSDAAVGIGDNVKRAKLLTNLQQLGFNLPVVVHPTAAISPHTNIGKGTVVFAQTVVNIGASLGVGCIVNTGAKIDHDCVLEAAVHISPGVSLAGGVSIGACSWIGVGTSVKQLIVIGRNVTVGIGSAVVKNLPDGVTAVGVPAHIVEKK